MVASIEWIHAPCILPALQCRRVTGRREHRDFIERAGCVGVAVSAASKPTEFFRWYITDERTGQRRLNRYAMTPEPAAELFPEGAEPDLRTREVRDLPDELRGNSRPPEARPTTSCGSHRTRTYAGT